MQTYTEDIPFTFAKHDFHVVKKMNTAYDELIGMFPQLYSLLIVVDGELVFEQYHNLINKHQAYSIKSITKSIMNALCGIAIHEGLIPSVNSYITDLIPSVDKALLKNVEGVTVEHLLTMTHGLNIDENGTEMLEIWNSNNWVDEILNKPLKSEPGEQFFYCTCTTHILSALITYLSKVPLSYYAQKNLFYPLGIISPIYWETDPQGVNWGGTNMFLTPRMLARFGQLYLADGIWNGQRLLPKQFVKQSLSMQVTGWDNYADYGYLWWVSQQAQTKYAFASGYGGQYVYIIPEHKAVIVLTADSNIAIQDMQAAQNTIIKDPNWLVNRFIL